jgi:hypothetical protein
MRMDEQFEYSTSETFSLTPRLIAVKGEGLESKTVSTVFLPEQMFVSKVSARLMTNRRMKIGGRKLLKQLADFDSPCSP